MSKIVLLFIFVTALGSEQKNKPKNDKNKKTKTMTKSVYEHKFPKTSSDDTKSFAGISQNNSNLNNENLQKAPTETMSRFSNEVSETQPRHVCSKTFTDEELKQMYSQPRQSWTDQTYQNLLNPKHETPNRDGRNRRVPPAETYPDNLPQTQNLISNKRALKW
jgi:hypothetical protein